MKNSVFNLPKIISITLSAVDRSSIHAEMILPEKTGGYLLLAEFIADGSKNPVISRRFIKVGEVPEF